MTTFSTILPSDVRALKVRVSPSVMLVDARVTRAPSLARDLRAGWQAFAKEWNEYVTDDVSVFSPSNYEKGLDLERKLRDWKSVLSSQCPGVVQPGPKHPTPFFGTWASPTDVRTQKSRTDPQFREVNAAMAACPSLDEVARRAWSQFFRAWVEFFNEDDSFIHGAALYERAVAYEDELPEWRELLERICVAAPSTPPGAPGFPNAPPEAPPGGFLGPFSPNVPPNVPPSSGSPDTFTMGTVLVVAAVVAGLGVAIMNGKSQ